MQMTNSLMGFERYMNRQNKSMFDDIVLPEGIDKSVLVNTILVESGDFEVLYTNPEFMHLYIKNWFLRKNKTFEHWVAATNTNYNPLENYDRIENYEDNVTGSFNNTSSNNSNSSSSNTINITTNGEFKNTGSTNGTDTRSTTVNSDVNDSMGAQSSTTENKVSAFDSSDYSPKDNTDTNNAAYTDTHTTESATNDSLTSANSSSDSGTNSNKTNTGTSSSNETIESGNTSGTNTNKNVHSGRIHGNIGVTTSQQMLDAEMKLWASIDVYKSIADLFVTDFCIMIY